MSPSDLFLAALMLAAPVGSPEPTPPEDRWPVVRAALLAVAVDWEVLDPRESRYVLAKPEDFTVDLDFLRKRCRELADAPRLSDARRLPERHQIDQCIQFNRAYKRYLETRLLWEPDRAVAILEALRETERLYRLWDAVRDARCEFHYVSYRRQALKKLRDGVGESDYLAGVLPPYVPFWHFSPAP